VSKRVRIAENVEFGRRNLYYTASDLFVGPADNPQECSPLAPLEAMACGLPQVAADWNGYRDEVSHGETGLLVPTYWGDAIMTFRIAEPSWAGRLTTSQ